jgi:hypothetical protein
MRWWQKPRQERKLQSLLFEGLIFGCGVAVPQLAFELSKFLVLGPEGYASNWSLYFQGLVKQGLSDKNEGFLTIVTNRFESLHQRFGLWPVGMLLVLFLGFWGRSGSQSGRRIALTISTAILCMGFYWMFKSLGWPRYFVIQLILLAALAAYLAATAPRSQFVAILLVILLTFAGGAEKMKLALNRPDQGLFRWSTDRMEREKAADQMISELNQRNPLLVSGWWASVADFLYHLQGEKQFVKFQQSMLANSELEFLYASNRKFGAELAKVHYNKFDNLQKHFDGPGYFLVESSSSYPPHTGYRAGSGQSVKPKLSSEATGRLWQSRILEKCPPPGDFFQLLGNGIRIHAQSNPQVVSFNLNGEFQQLEFHAFIEELPDSALLNKKAGVVAVQILMDGKYLGRWIVDASRNFSKKLNLYGAQELKVIVDSAKETISCDWLNIGFSEVPAEK